MGERSPRLRRAHSGDLPRLPRRRAWSARPSPCSTRAAGQASSGADVVVGFAETHGRVHTAEQIADLPVMPRRRFEHHGPRLRGDGRRRHPGPPSRAGAGRRAGPHQRARLAQPQTPPGRGRAPRRRHRRHHHRQHPAPGVAQRRRRRDHRDPPARDGARPGGAGSRSGGEHRRHVAGGTTAAAGPRQRLCRRQGRRRPRQLLPRRQPVGAPRTWRCSGWPIASTTPSPTIACATGSPPHGKRERVVVAVSGAPGGARLVRHTADHQQAPRAT